MLVAAFGLEMPFWLTLIFSAAAVIVALTLEEPRFHRPSEELGYWEHIADTARFLSGRKAILHLVLLWVLLQATFIIADEYAQLYYAAIGLPIVFFGLLGTAGNFLEGMGGWAGERLARLSRGKLYPTLVLFSALGFALSAGLRGAWGIPFIFLSMAAFYLAIPLLLGDLHRQLPSAQRATGESFVNLLSRLAFIPLALDAWRMALPSLLVLAAWRWCLAFIWVIS
jgi:hypothetical protein